MDYNNASYVVIGIGTSSMFELRPIDEKEQRIVEEFLEKTCGCRNVNGGPCSVALAEKFLVARARCAELDKTSLDYVLLGQVMASMNTGTDIISRRRPSKERERNSYKYYHEGVKVKHRHCYYQTYLRIN